MTLLDKVYDLTVAQLPEAEVFPRVIPFPGRGNARHLLVRFPNGYGVSIVQSTWHYCDENTFEATPVTFGNSSILSHKVLLHPEINPDDVLGWQTPQDIRVLLFRVSALERR